MNQMQTKKERLTPLTQEQIGFYEENGYYLLEKGCSDDLIEAFNSHVQNIRSADPLADWAKVKEDKDRFSVRLFNPHLHDGFSEQMMKLPVVRGVLGQLMGDEPVGVQTMYFYKEPGSPGQAAHQDFYYIRPEPDTMIAAWIALEEEVDEENGCLWIIPKSHKLGLLPHGQVKNLIEHEPWTDETEGINLKEQVPVRMKKGDILFFHSLLIHSSNRNHSKDRWRRSFVTHCIRHDSGTYREDLKKKFPLY